MTNPHDSRQLKVKKSSQTQTTNKGDNMKEKLLRLPQVLEILPISPATWWKGVREGRFPSSIKLGPRTTCWKESDIMALFGKVAQRRENNASAKKPPVDKTGGEKKAVRWDREDDEKHNPQWVHTGGRRLNDEIELGTSDRAVKTIYVKGV